MAESHQITINGDSFLARRGELLLDAALSNGIDLGDYGSRGQVRTTLLSHKLAEVEWMKARTGRSPVLLLDEVLAELDLQRRADLLAYVSSMEQALLTTTDLHLFAPEFVQQAQTWGVSAGTVQVTKED